MSLATEPALPSPDDRQHVAALDGLRGAAILMVMIHHMTNLTMGTGVDRIYFGLSELGGSGVDLFFVLSGYLITGILLDAREQTHYFRNFYMRRVLRILPLNYLLVFACLVVLPRISGGERAAVGDMKREGIFYWLYLSNFVIAYQSSWQHRILDTTWSLSIEEQFYLIWPAIVLWCRRRTLLITCAALIVIALLTRAALIATGSGLIRIVTFTPCRLDGLAVGSAVAVLARNGQLHRVLKPALWVIPAAFVYLAWTHRTIALWDTDPTSQVFGYTAETLMYGGILALIIERPLSRLSGMLSMRWLGVFGRFSYALYLFHMPIRAAVRDTLYGPDHYLKLFGSALPGQFIFYALAISATMIVAVISWYGFEMHFLKLKRLFPMPRKAMVKEITDQTAHQTQSRSA